MKYFLLFLLWTFIGSSYAATMALWRAYVCYKSRCVIPPTHTMIMCVFSTIMAIFFAIFVVAMMWDQYTGMTTDTTGIEAMKGWDETPRNLGEGLNDVCGEKCSWRWFLPISMPKDSPSFYQWSKDDDPDAFDDRDPIVQRHMERVKQLAVHYDAKRLLGEDINLDDEQQQQYYNSRPSHRLAHEHEETSDDEDEEEEIEEDEEENDEDNNEDNDEDDTSSESSKEILIVNNKVIKPNIQSKLSMKSENNQNNHNKGSSIPGNDGVRKRNK